MPVPTTRSRRSCRHRRRSPSPGRAVSTTSTARTVTFTNSTPDPQTIATVDIDGNAAADFAITNETCTTGPVAANATCTVDVTFTPGALGARDAEVRLQDATPAIVGTVALEGLGQAVSHVGWGALRTAGPSSTWSYGSELARSITSTSTRYLQAVYTTDRVGGRFATDHGPYLGVYYIRSASSTGTTWSTPVRINPSTRHGDDATIATSGSYVYVAWVSQTKWVNFNPSAPRALYIRVNSNYGKGTLAECDPTVADDRAGVRRACRGRREPRLRLLHRFQYRQDPAVHQRQPWADLAVGDARNDDGQHVHRQAGRRDRRGQRLDRPRRLGGRRCGASIKARRSTNSGSTWESTVTLANGSRGSAGRGRGRRPGGGRMANQQRSRSQGADRLGLGAGPSRDPARQRQVVRVGLRAGDRPQRGGSGRSRLDRVLGRLRHQRLPGRPGLVGDGEQRGRLVRHAARRPASSSAYHVNDGAAVIWPATGRPTIMWNGWTPNTAPTRMYLRSSVRYAVTERSAA